MHLLLQNRMRLGPPPDPRADGEMVWQPERRCFLILVAKRFTTQTS